MPIRSARSISAESRTARSTRSCSIGVRGCMAAIVCWIRSLSSRASSWGSTGMIVRAVMPCLYEFKRTVDFPFADLGPVLRFEFLRFASICAVVAMVANSPVQESGEDVRNVVVS